MIYAKFKVLTGRPLYALYWPCLNQKHHFVPGGITWGHTQFNISNPYMSLGIYVLKPSFRCDHIYRKEERFPLIAAICMSIPNE